MKTIENLEQLNDVLRVSNGGNEECILRIFDNKSDVLLQTICVKHPVSFIRNLPDFAKNCNIPVSDVSVQLIGYILKDNNLEAVDIVEISPYVYFKKPDVIDDSTKEN